MIQLQFRKINSRKLKLKDESLDSYCREIESNRRFEVSVMTLSRGRDRCFCLPGIRLLIKTPSTAVRGARKTLPQKCEGVNIDLCNGKLYCGFEK